MIAEQIVARGIKDKRVLSAMQKIERHLFVPESLQNEAYGDYPLPIGENQTISQPYMVASMTEELKLTPEDKVLEIGTGSGYQTAVLAEIAREVYSVERMQKLAEEARTRLNTMGYENVVITESDGSEGLPEHSPYDAIIVTAGAKTVPQPLLQQLRENGRLVIPVGERLVQTLMKFTKINSEIRQEKLFDCMFVPLIGENGW